MARVKGFIRVGTCCLGLGAALSMSLGGCALDDRAPREVVTMNQPDPGDPTSATPQDGMTAAAGAGGAGAAAAPGGAEPGGSDPGGAGPGGADPGGAEGGADPGTPPGTGGAGAGSGAGASGGSGQAAGAGSMGGGLDPSDLPGGGDGPATGDGSCPAFTPCGGELSGSWAYVETCPTSNVALLQVACPTGTVAFEPGGAAALTFSDGQVARSGSPVGDSVITFPAECAFDGCATIGAFVGSAGQCSDVGGGCACRTPFSVDWGQQAFTTNGTQLRLADGRTFEYCVQDDRLTYRETGSATEPGVFTLQRN